MTGASLPNQTSADECPDCREPWDFCCCDDDSDEVLDRVCKYGGPAPCVDDICNAIGGCMGYGSEPT